MSQDGTDLGQDWDRSRTDLGPGKIWDGTRTDPGQDWDRSGTGWNGTKTGLDSMGQEAT